MTGEYTEERPCEGDGGGSDLKAKERHLGRS